MNNPPSVGRETARIEAKPSSQWKLAVKALPEEIQAEVKSNLMTIWQIRRNSRGMVK